MNIYLEWYIYNLYILCVGKFGWQDVSGGVIRVLSEADVKDMLLSVAWGWMEEGDAWEAEVISDEANNGMWGQIKLCIFKVNGWKEDDVKVERWNGSISDWDGKVAWAEEGGAGLQGVWQWGGWGCVPLATAVLCMEFLLATSSGSHGQCRGRRWRQNSPYTIICM